MCSDHTYSKKPHIDHSYALLNQQSLSNIANIPDRIKYNFNVNHILKYRQ